MVKRRHKLMRLSRLGLTAGGRVMKWAAFTVGSGIVAYGAATVETFGTRGGHGTRYEPAFWERALGVTISTFGVIGCATQLVAEIRRTARACQRRRSSVESLL